GAAALIRTGHAGPGRAGGAQRRARLVFSENAGRQIMKPPTFEEITARLAKWEFPAGVDGVVGIAWGGVVPAALVAQRLGVGLKTIRVTYRDEKHGTRFMVPKVASEIPGVGAWKRLLLVDDLYLSGRSWQAGRALL